MTSPWHAPPTLLARFVEDPSSLDDATAASLEAHLIACAECRGQVATRTDEATVAASWDAVADRIDRPRASLLEWTLHRLGVRSGPARLAAATPGLRLSGLAAVAGLTAVAVAASRVADADGPFLLVAPLVPLAAVALTFAPAADPAGEAGIATPTHGAGLALQRALAVLVLALGVLGAGAVGLPELGSVPLGWVLPATALAVGSLALGTWMRVELAVAGLSGAWAVGIGIVRYLEGHGHALADTPPFSAAGQGVALALTVLAAVVLATRADRYTTLEARG